MTWEEFETVLRSLPRELSQEEVDQRVAARDRDRGLYVPHGGEVHHSSEESRH